MAVYKPLHNALLERGIWTELEGRTVHMKMDRMAALGILKDPERKSFLLRAGVPESHVSHIDGHIERAREGFCGGTKEDLVSQLNGDVDLNIYTNMYKKLQETGLIARLRTKGALSKPRRKRRMSEHDGEWEFDRKWDLKPFQYCERKQQKVKSIKLMANFSCSGGSNASDINKYGALVWAITQVIEDAGIQVEIYYQEKAKNVGRKTDVNNVILLKKPGEYLSPQVLAAAFTANFYRRLGFCLQSIATAVNDNDVSDSSMGQAIQSSPIEFKDGELVIDKKANLMEYDVIEREIMKVIGGENEI